MVTHLDVSTEDVEFVGSVLPTLVRG